MPNTPAQEAEEIRDGLDQIMKDAARPMLDAMIATVWNVPVKQSVRQAMVDIGLRMHALHQRRAVLEGKPAPAEPGWLKNRPPAAVSKVTIVERLQAAGKLQVFADQLAAANLYNRMRWDSRAEFRSDDNRVIAVLTGIGADPAAILAPE